MDEFNNTQQAASKQCINCSVAFCLTAGEHIFYRSRALELPKRCKPCREANRARFVTHRRPPRMRSDAGD